MGDSFDKSIQELLSTLEQIKCIDNIAGNCRYHTTVIRDKIKYIVLNLNEINRIENRLLDLDSNLNNNEDISKIMKYETKDSDVFLDDQKNHFSVENYQLDELNNNKNIIDKNMDLYLTQLKKLFYIICALIFVYFILISFTPPNQ